MKPHTGPGCAVCAERIKALEAILAKRPGIRAVEDDRYRIWSMEAEKVLSGV